MSPIFIALKFRRGVKRNLPPFGTPDVMPILGLIESLDRLLNVNVKGEKYEGYINVVGIRSSGSRNVVNDGLRWS